MDQIGEVINQLDTNAKGKQQVHVYPFHYADPQEALTLFQDIFQKNGAQTSRSGTSSQSPLVNRSSTQGQQNSSSSTRSSSGSSSRGGGVATFGQ
jgi:hypothetical protein